MKSQCDGIRRAAQELACFLLAEAFDDNEKQRLPLTCRQSCDRFADPFGHRLFCCRIGNRAMGLCVEATL